MLQDGCRLYSMGFLDSSGQNTAMLTPTTCTTCVVGLTPSRNTGLNACTLDSYFSCDKEFWFVLSISHQLCCSGSLCDICGRTEAFVRLFCSPQPYSPQNIHVPQTYTIAYQFLSSVLITPNFHFAFWLTMCCPFQRTHNLLRPLSKDEQLRASPFADTLKAAFFQVFTFHFIPCFIKLFVRPFCHTLYINLLLNHSPPL